MADQKKLRDEAQRIYDQLRSNLLQGLQVGNPRAFAHGNPRANLIHRSPLSNPNQGQSFLNGVMPNEAQISAYVQQHPEYQRAVAALKKSGAAGANSRGGQVSTENGKIPISAPPAGPSAAMQLFNDYYQNLQGDWREARDANVARYDEGKKELGGVRDFRQEKYANFGEAAQQDIDERLSENAKQLRARAASRGLANSNEPDAYILRAARDAAREQQRVREMRDSRMADAYAQDTGNLVGFIERRDDPYPDVNQALQLGIQLSESEANRAAEQQRLNAMMQYRGTGGRGRSDVRLPPLPGPQGGVIPYFANGTPLQMANAQFANRGPQLGIASNRYPTARSPQEYAAIRKAMQKQATLSPTVSLPGTLPEGWDGNATMQPTLAPAPKPPQYLPPGWNGAATMQPNLYNRPLMGF